MVQKLLKFPIRLVQYSPILFHDQDWDYGYMINIIVFKLKRMRSCLEKSTISDHSLSITQINETIEHFRYHLEPERGVPEQEVRNLLDCINENGVLEFNSEEKAYFDKLNEKEQESWEKAWNNIRMYGQNWWD